MKLTFVFLLCMTFLPTNYSFTYSAGGLQGFYNLAKLLINSAAPNRVAYDHIRQLITHTFSGDAVVGAFQVWELSRSSLLECVALMTLVCCGFLFMVFVPLIGLFICCLRLYRSQKPPEKPSQSYCIFLTATLLICTLFMVVGTCLYVVNEFQSFDDLASNLEGNVVDQLIAVEDFVTATMRDFKRFTLDELFDVFTFTQAEQEQLLITVSYLLRNQTGINSMSQLNNTVPEILAFGIKFTDRLNLLALESHNLNSTSLTEFYAQPHSQLRLSIDSISMGFTDFANIINDGNFPVTLKNIDGIMSSVAQIVRSKKDSFNIQIGDVVNDITKANKTVRQYLAKISTLKDTVTNAKISSVVGSWGWFRWVLLAVISPICLMIILILFGLIFGCREFNKCDKPGERKRSSNGTGNLLCASVAVAVIFSSFLMAVTIGTFLIGAAGETLICRTFYPDPTNFVRFLNETKLVEFPPNIPPAIDVVQSCKDNKTVYTAFQLRKTFAIGKILNLMPADLHIELNSKGEELITAVDNFTKSALIHLLNLTQQTFSVLSEFTFNESVSSPNTTLSCLVNESCYSNEAFLNLLKVTGDEIYSIISSNSSIETVKLNMNGLTVNLTSKVKNRLYHSRQIILDGFNNRLGNCRSLYEVYDNLNILLCHQLLNPINGVWLGLGWCLLMFLPFIFIGFKLSSYLMPLGTSKNIISDERPTELNVNQMEAVEPVQLSYPPTTVWHS